MKLLKEWHRAQYVWVKKINFPSPKGGYSIGAWNLSPPKPLMCADNWLLVVLKYYLTYCPYIMAVLFYWKMIKRYQRIRYG